MGIDAIALLRIPKLEPPKCVGGTTYFVDHRKDCSLLHTMNRFHGIAPVEHALALRKILGDALDAHDDPRGVYFFPDVCEPAGEGYDVLLESLGGAGVWAPKVTDGHVPACLTEDAPGTCEVRDEAMRAEEQQRMARMATLRSRMESGEPLVSSDEVRGLLQSEGARELLASLAPGVTEELSKAMREMNVDLEALPDDDLGKQLALAMGLGPGSRS